MNFHTSWKCKRRSSTTSRNKSRTRRKSGMQPRFVMFFVFGVQNAAHPNLFAGKSGNLSGKCKPSERIAEGIQNVSFEQILKISYP